MSGSLCPSVPIPLSVSFTLPTYWFAFLSIYLSRPLCFYLYLHLLLYLSGRKNYATLPSKVKVGRPKALHFCDTFSKNGSSQPQNETKSKSTTSNMKEFCKTSFKTERSASCHCVVWFLLLAPVGTKRRQAIRSAASARQNHLCRPEDWDLQNATFLRKPVPGVTLTVSDWDEFGASCEMHLCRSSQRPTPACLCFCWLFARCGIHCACHARPHPTFKKSPETVSLLVLWTCEWCWHRRGVHFFDISEFTKCSKHDVFFAPFDFELRFAPHWRALISTSHLSNFQKCFPQWNGF